MYGLEGRNDVRMAWAPAQEEMTAGLLRLVKERLSNDDDLGTLTGPLVTRMEERNGLIDPIVQIEN